MAKDVVRLEGLAAAQGRAYKLQLRVVAAFESAILHGNKRRGAFAHGFDCFLDVGIANLRSFDLDLQAFVGAELEFGQHFETGAKLEWTIFRVLYMIDLRLRDRHELLVLDSLVDLFGNERLQDLALDVVGETAADQGNGGFAWTKSRDAGNTGKLARHTLDRFLHFGGGNLEIELTPTSHLGHDVLIFVSTSLVFVRLTAQFPKVVRSGQAVHSRPPGLLSR